MEVIKITFKNGNIRYLGNMGLANDEFDWQLVGKKTDAWGFPSNSECLKFLSTAEGFSTLSNITRDIEILKIEFKRINKKIKEFIELKNDINLNLKK